METEELAICPKKSIAIIGTRGIPNRYGGFEYFAQHLSENLLLKGYQPIVIQPSKTELNPFNGITRIPISIEAKSLKNPINRLRFGLKSLVKAKKIGVRAVICCGHSPALFFPLFSKSFRKKLVVNLDGLEWNREKWGFWGRTLLRITERFAVKYSSVLISDNKGIQDYYLNKYSKKTHLISYGVNIPQIGCADEILFSKGLRKKEYGLVIARIEPENQMETAIQAFVDAQKKLVIIGSLNTPHAKTLLKKYLYNPLIIFWREEFDEQILNPLRKHCNFYFHGHKVGGTNPSLLQAMSCQARIIAHSNAFNRNTLGEAGYYFTNQKEASKIISEHWNSTDNKGEMALSRALHLYSWEPITEAYIHLVEML